VSLFSMVGLEAIQGKSWCPYTRKGGSGPTIERRLVHSELEGELTATLDRSGHLWSFRAPSERRLIFFGAERFIQNHTREMANCF
jgi:hypothetical protein